ncbi:MAG: GNAT family N-acetyltransferase [Devosia sp.]
MTVSDIGDCDDLVVAAGWNQRAADWAIMLRLGRGECIRDAAGHVIATAIVLPYGAFGWISMVLVEPLHRGRGLATSLLQSAIAWLMARNIVPVLDATAAGRAIYAPLGFSGGAAITRWRGRGMAISSLRPVVAADAIGAAVRLDQAAFGASRSALLEDMAIRPNALMMKAREGCLLTRAGRTATQIGPLIADGDEHAIGLLERALAEIAGPVLLDVPAGRDAIDTFLAVHGFTAERSFERMTLGDPRFTTIDKTMHAIAGPEYG